MPPNDTSAKKEDLHCEEFSEEEKAHLRVELFLQDLTRQTNAEIHIMTVRWQIWVGGATQVSLLPMMNAPTPECYITGIIPWLLAFAAQYAGSGEGALRIIRLFLRFAAQQVGYARLSYETFYDSFVRVDHGGGRQGLRNTLLLCQATISTLLLIRLWKDLFTFLPLTHSLILVGMVGTATVALIEGVAIRKTWRWLREPPKPKQKTPPTGEEQDK